MLSLKNALLFVYKNSYLLKWRCILKTFSSLSRSPFFSIRLLIFMAPLRCYTGTIHWVWNWVSLERFNYLPMLYISREHLLYLSFLTCDNNLKQKSSNKLRISEINILVVSLHFSYKLNTWNPRYTLNEMQTYFRKWSIE